MTSYAGPKFRNAADTRTPFTGRSQSEPASADPATKLTPRAAVLVILALSFGLWAAVWQVVSSLR